MSNLDMKNSILTEMDDLYIDYAHYEKQARQLRSDSLAEFASASLIGKFFSRTGKYLQSHFAARRNEQPAAGISLNCAQNPAACNA